MKKYFSFILALIMILSGCSQANPPRTSSDSGSVSGNANAQHSEALGFICIEDISTLEDIREVLTMDDMNEEEFMEHVLSAYPRVPIGGTGITKQDFADMLERFDSMLVPVLPDVELSYIEYSPDRFYGRFTVFYVTEDGESYHFTFFPFSENFYFANMISNYTNETPVLLYQKEESNLKVYENNVYDTPGACWYCLDISGKFYEASFSNTDLKAGIIDKSMISAQDVYNDLTLGPLNEVPWVDRSAS